MAALNFPASPVLNQVYISNNNTWKWDGMSWVNSNAGVVGPPGPSGVGVPIGGETNQVLLKNSSTDYDTVWGTAVTSSSTENLTNKTIDLGSNTITGTLAEFNSSLSDNDFASLAGSETLSNKILLTPISVGSKETKVIVPSSTIDVTTGNYFTKTATSALTWAVSNVPISGAAVSFILDLTNGGVSAQTWWSGVKWAGGIAPTLTAAGRDVLGFFTHDAGVTWSGLVLGKNLK